MKDKSRSIAMALGIVVIFSLMAGCASLNPPTSEIAGNNGANGTASQVSSAFSGSYAMKTTEATLNNPEITGTLISITWQKIQPCKKGTKGTSCEEGDYDWSQIDKELKLAKAAGKQVTLNIQAGGAQTPDWVRNIKGVQLISFLDTNKFRKSSCDTFSMPVYWDPVFLEKKRALIAELGKRYGSNPDIRGVMIQSVQTFANDWYLPRMQSTREVCPGNPDENQIAKWIEIGYSTEKMYGAGKETIDAWATAFPKKALNYPIHRTDEQLDSTPSELTEKIVDYGYGAYPDRFFVQVNTLKTSTPFATDKKITQAGPDDSADDYYILQILTRHPNHIGFQMAAAATNGPLSKDEGGDGCRQNNGENPCDPKTVLQNSVEIALSYKPAYIEFWQEDAENPELQDVLKYANQGIAGG
jgi:hypothetical protein